ncbi:DUF3099 domain-containing protein [Brevibacterium linens]|uniref:GETHR pentapeptide repeat-containing protein n=3 Tax=Brevibacterium linens TaxID=1703 RepID=A0A2H1HNW6_BRELN|nr:DUF3099 domain-containing protein [Brevibacterium linens]SMX63798.1 GETHR pentapeptide repeat-containing protein [Brevibacterium linens ATCC 9172]SMX64609.1 GETHR pentapeptide repeat-containing protein [Brevibacterium linens]
MFGSHRSKKDMVRHAQQITTADTALDDDMRSRIIKYSITMGIRTVCFVAAYFAFVADLHILMWICVAGAVVLPYPAVIFANAGRERTSDDRSALLDQAPLAELPPARGETISGDTLDGETVEEETVGDADSRGGADPGVGAPDATDPGADHQHETIRGETIPGETVRGETVDDNDEDRRDQV